MSSNFVDSAKMSEEKPKKKKWVKAAVKDKGALHRHLGVPEGEKIPEAKLHEALNSKDEKIRKEAQLAVTLGKMKRKPKKLSSEERMKKMYGSDKNG